MCPAPGVPSLTEEQLGSMCPSAAAIAAIVKPGMKFFDVSLMGQTRAGWHGLTQVFKLIFTCDELYSAVLHCVRPHSDLKTASLPILVESGSSVQAPAVQTRGVTERDGSAVKS